MKLEMNGSVGIISFTEGAPKHLLLGSLAHSGEIKDITKLSLALKNTGNLKIDFYQREPDSLITTEYKSTELPLDPVAAQTMIDFLYDALLVSGAAIEQAFGLGTMPIIEKSFRESTHAFPAFLGPLNLNNDFTLDKQVMTAAINNLPYTGRRAHVLHAFKSLLIGRFNSIRETLSNERKRKKAIKAYLSVWEKYEARFKEADLSEDLIALLDQLQLQGQRK